MSAPSKQEVTQAVATISFSRETHVIWRDYLRDHASGCKGCGRDHSKDVDVAGDQTYHETAIAEYDQVLDVLRRIP